ncbi:MAG: hypothetical protein KF753_13150 [Caldilineaceae bacterium]|nr:hypothetical protein [Caldilineaceae bacterium]
MHLTSFVHKKPVYLLLAMCFALLLSSMLAIPAWAGEEDEQPDGMGETQSASVDAPQATQDDGGDWELGIHGSAGNLKSATAAERAGMNFWLSPASNWVTRYIFDESSAWEQDFKRNDLGGTNGSYIDAVDLQFYVGHGSPSGFTFDNANHDDGTLTSADCYRAWGDNDNEWLALTSCQVLGNSNLSGWASCMYGQHLIMGFVTNASAYNNMFSTQAYHFGRYIRQNYSMPQAWYKACDVAQRGRTTRTIINELACLNDKPNSGQVCADSFDTDWWYQTHSCGTETAISVPSEDIRTLPVYRMAPYGLDEAKADFSNLGNVFGIPVTATLTARVQDQIASDYFTGTAGALSLELDKGSGIFSFSDLDQLWTATQAEQAMAVNAASADYIDSDDARTIADNFLRTNNLNGTGATFYEVISDTISSQIDTADPVRAAQLVAEGEQTPLLWQVIYSRRLTATVVSAAGLSEEIQFSVVGPGAKQKVYVPVTAGVGAASILETKPVGVLGGWREVAPAVNAATGDALSVAILTADQVRELYMALPEDVTLNDVPLDVSKREIISHTIAYWEEASGVSQGQLIPVYELKVNMTERESQAVVEEFVYVPASELYMRPLARIVGTPTQPVIAGTAITLTAADATQTLRTLKLADFDIALGTGEYSYEWFLDGTKIGNGQVLKDYVVPLSTDQRDIALTFEVRVTDTSSPNQSASTDRVTLAGSRGIYLPTVNR